MLTASPLEFLRETVGTVSHWSGWSIKRHFRITDSRQDGPGGVTHGFVCCGGGLCLVGGDSAGLEIAKMQEVEIAHRSFIVHFRNGVNQRGLLTEAVSIWRARWPTT